MSSVNKSASMHRYRGSKTGLHHTCTNLAHYFGLKVRVNDICTGATRTAAVECFLIPDMQRTVPKHTPIKSLGTTDDIARENLYFAS
jgi:7-alpha-hydroxysteroid dehydrogenase